LGQNNPFHNPKSVFKILGCRCILTDIWYSIETMKKPTQNDLRNTIMKDLYMVNDKF